MVRNGLKGLRAVSGSSPRHVVCVDCGAYAGIEPVAQADEFLEALRPQALGQGVGILVVPGWLRVDDDAQPGRLAVSAVTK